MSFQLQNVFLHVDFHLHWVILKNYSISGVLCTAFLEVSNCCFKLPSCQSKTWKVTLNAGENISHAELLYVYIANTKQVSFPQIVKKKKCLQDILKMTWYIVPSLHHLHCNVTSVQFDQQLPTSLQLWFIRAVDRLPNVLSCLSNLPILMSLFKRRELSV